MKEVRVLFQDQISPVKFSLLLKNNQELREGNVDVLFTDSSMDAIRPSSSSLQALLLKRLYQRLEHVDLLAKLDREKKRPKNKISRSRSNLKTFKALNQQKHCAYCNLELNRKPIPGSSLNATVDHFVPISKGGADEWYNFKMSCSYCNSVKNDIHPLEEEEKWHEFLAFVGSEHERC